jgi:hypothetical protein
MRVLLSLALLSVASGEQLWPKPQEQTLTGQVYSLDPYSFAFNIVGETSSILSSAIDRYYALTFYRGMPPCSVHAC